MQMYRNAKFPCAGREMRESLRRIDNARGVQFQWNLSVGTGSESVLDSHPYLYVNIVSTTIIALMHLKNLLI